MSEIGVKEDILKRLSEKYNEPISKISKIFDFAIDDISEQVQKKNCYSVYLPSLGTLYVKYPLIKKVNSLSRNYIKKMFLKESFKKGLFHYTALKIRTKYYTKGKSIKELQEFQNG